MSRPASQYVDECAEWAHELAQPLPGSGGELVFQDILVLVQGGAKFVHGAHESILAGLIGRNEIIGPEVRS